MMNAGISEELAATASSTLRRWRVRDRNGEAIAHRRGPRSSPPPSPELLDAAEQFVEDVRGHVGAAAIGKAIGIPRRAAAAIKAAVITEMECERKLRARRVEISVPGIVRGFDQMYVATLGGWRFALLSADASIPYRTSAHVAERYLGDDVCTALDLDYEMNGAPLVERLDRAAAHRTPRVLELLRAHRVLPLHLAKSVISCDGLLHHRGDKCLFSQGRNELQLRFGIGPGPRDHASQTGGRVSVGPVPTTP
jgi:hypothetical protein